jgi:hypothetical protein
MVVEAVYLGFVIGNLLLTTAFRFQVSAFRFQHFSVSVFQHFPIRPFVLWSVVRGRTSAFRVSAFQHGPHPPPRATEAAMVLLGLAATLLRFVAFCCCNPLRPGPSLRDFSSWAAQEHSYQSVAKCPFWGASLPLPRPSSFTHSTAAANPPSLSHDRPNKIWRRALHR